MKQATKRKQFVTPKEAAKMLEVSKSTIYNYIELGHLKGLKRGPGIRSRLVIPMSEVERFMSDYR